MTLDEAKKRAEELRYLIRTGGIDYAKGRAELADCLAILDAEGQRIAKRYGMRYKKISINAYLR